MIRILQIGGCNKSLSFLNGDLEMVFHPKKREEKRKKGKKERKRKKGKERRKRKK